MTHSKLGFKFITTAVLCSFLMTIIFYSCKKDSTTVAADKTALIAKIAEAQTLYDGTTEGTKPGQYVIGSKAPLKTAIDAGNVVVADATATQSTVTNATAQVQAAIDAYKANLIQEIAAANLIGFWKFNGNPSDSSGHGNNGTLVTGATLYGAGLPVLTTDRFGRSNMAYHFDMGGNIDIPYSSSLNPTEMTISLWCTKSTLGRIWDPSTYTMIALDRWNGFKFQLQGGNLTFFTVKVIEPAGDTTIYDRDNAGVALNNDEWYHVAVAYKAGEEDLYVNGTLVKQWTNTPGTPITVSSAIDFIIGQDLPTDKYLTVDGDYQVAWGGFWTGDLDDVMFYNIALTGPQISSIYENQKTL